MKFKPNQEVVCTNSNWYSMGDTPLVQFSASSYPVKDSLYTVKAQSPGLPDFIELHEFPGNYWGEDNFEPVVPQETIKELLEYVPEPLEV